MPNLIRITKIRYVKNGKRVPKGTPGAKKVSEKTSKWYGQGIPGYHPKKRFPLATDKTAAQRMLNDLVRDAEQGRARMPDQAEGRKNLAEHLTAFRGDLALGLGSVGPNRRKTAPDPKQVNLVVQRIQDVLTGCSFKSVADLNAQAPKQLGKYLSGRVEQPKAEGGISAQTAAFMLAAARRFVRWLSKKRVGVSADLFDGLPSFDPTNERVHARRDVSFEELGRVLDAARASNKVVRGMAGIDRHQIYQTAFATGFRASELAALTPAHFSLEGDEPSVSLAGKKTKNKKGAVQHPLPLWVATDLRQYLAGKPIDKPIWPGQWRKYAADMLRVDLETAGVPFCVEGPNGKAYADFHALRHTYCTALAASGAKTKVLQNLAQHSDVRLTLGTYTHADRSEEIKAVGMLRAPGQSQGPISPLAGMTRDDLEGAVFGLLGIIRTVFYTGPVTSGSPSGVAAFMVIPLGVPRGVPPMEIPGVDTAHLDTISLKHKRV